MSIDEHIKAVRERLSTILDFNEIRTNLSKKVDNLQGGICKKVYKDGEFNNGNKVIYFTLNKYLPYEYIYNTSLNSKFSSIAHRLYSSDISTDFMIYTSNDKMNYIPNTFSHGITFDEFDELIFNTVLTYSDKTDIQCVIDNLVLNYVLSTEFKLSDNLCIAQFDFRFRDNNLSPIDVHTYLKYGKEDNDMH